MHWHIASRAWACRTCACQTPCACPVPAGTCGHEWCKRCIEGYARVVQAQGGGVHCPLCRTQLVAAGSSGAQFREWRTAPVPFPHAAGCTPLRRGHMLQRRPMVHAAPWHARAVVVASSCQPDRHVVCPKPVITPPPPPSAHAGVCIRLRDTIAKLFPEQAAARAADAAADAAAAALQLAQDAERGCIAARPPAGSLPPAAPRFELSRGAQRQTHMRC